MGLTEGDLQDAAELCLEAAATTDLDQIVGGGNFARRMHHARRKRSLEAIEKSRDGEISILFFGISADDCAWVAGRLKNMERKACQTERFFSAEETLRKETKV